MPVSKKPDNRAIKDHAWLATHGKKIPQAGIDTPATNQPSAVSADYEQLIAALGAIPSDRQLTLAELVELRHMVPPADPNVSRASLAERFLLPPFSVLDARQGYWQKRKKMWLELGIQSELGRGETPSTSARVGPDDEATYRTIGGRKKPDNGLLGEPEQARLHYKANATPGDPPGPSMDTYRYYGTRVSGDGRGRPLAQTFGSGRPGDLAAGFKEKGGHPESGGSTGKNSAYMFKTADGYKPLKELQADASPYNCYDDSDDTSRRDAAAQPQSGTSIFDPVLCEIAYRWFCPQAGRVLDPFAGGSVRGIVAARLGRAYAGMDLRQEQADANYAQMEVLCPDADLTWAVGDSAGIADLLPGEYDLVFSCPPYADLERYSDDPRDLSTMDYNRFLEVYRAIIAASCAMLKKDRFAVFVVGDVRDRQTGNYRGFVGDTVEAFRAAGLELYNEAVLVTAVGSLPIRVGKQFAGYRKLGKTHQNVLVFVKGDAGRAAAACGDVDVDDLEMPECVEGGVALCRGDAVGTLAEPYLMGDEPDVGHVYLPPMESYLLCDVLRGQARAEGRAAPRAWLGTKDSWVRLEDGADLTYLVGNIPYMSKAVFPDAKVPGDQPPPPKVLR